VNGAFSEKTHYVFQGLELIFEKRIKEGQADRIRSYVYAGAMLLARVDGVIGDTQAKKYWYHTDQVGSVKAVTNQAGAVVWNADYLPFGQQFGKNKFDSDFEEDDLGFTGKGYDSDVGLYYFNARWYDADTGRFISEDPVGDPSNPNLYTYGRNNPLSFNDPTGLESTNPGNVSTGTSGGGYGYDNGSGGVPGGGNPGTAGGPPGSPGTSQKTTQSFWQSLFGSHTTTNYDSNGNKTSEAVYDKTGNKKSEKTYDKGKLTSETYYNKNGTKSGYATYDQQGQTTLIAIYDRNGKLQSKAEMAYESYYLDGKEVNVKTTNLTIMGEKENSDQVAFTSTTTNTRMQWSDKSGNHYISTTNTVGTISDNDAGDYFASHLQKSVNFWEGQMNVFVEAIVGIVQNFINYFADQSYAFNAGDTLYLTYTTTANWSGFNGGWKTKGEGYCINNRANRRQTRTNFTPEESSGSFSGSH
jgi:RHS repeat-associated protein